jgi:hypothetical protein
MGRSAAPFGMTNYLNDSRLCITKTVPSGFEYARVTGGAKDVTLSRVTGTAFVKGGILMKIN